MLPVSAPAEATGAPKETPVGAKPLGIAFSVKMTGPYAQDSDLQIICAFKHKASGDTYQGAMKDSDAKVGGLISSLRNRGEFVGELGESILLVPPKGAIPARQLLIIGLGDEPALSLDTLRVVGRVAARKPCGSRRHGWLGRPSSGTKGNTTIDVGDGDRAFVESVLSAYDTELRLQAQGLAEKFAITEWVIEAARVSSTVRWRKSARGSRPRCRS
ncbi:MAG: M17 family peptidase N-terminal domain-containing protein [Chthoniobacter sp.]